MSIGVHQVRAWADPTGSTAGAPIDISCLVDDVQIQHGRDDTGSQPPASTATVTLDLLAGALNTGVDIGSALHVNTTIGGTTVVRFAGRITDVALGWDDEGTNTPNAGQGQIIAVSKLADLGRLVVGDTPWPQELDGARAQRILTSAGFPWDGATSDPGQVQILSRDVDSQAALDLLTGVADSAGGIVWQTRLGDVRYADSVHRRRIASSLTFDSCDVLVTPTWQRNLAGLINKVTIAYGVPPSGGEQPTTSDSNAESIARYGTYAFSFTSQLAALADAQAMVGLLLARNSSPVWVMVDLPIDVKGLSDADTITLLQLEMHALLTLTGLPAIGGAPTTANLWIEGWQERLAWDTHEIELHVSGYCRTSPAPLWDDMTAAQTWDSMPPALTWDGAVCVGPPLPGGRWTDVPANVRWNQIAATVTWDTWTVPT